MFPLNRVISVPPDVLGHKNREQRTASAAEGKRYNRYPITRTFVLDHDLGDDHALEHKGHVGEGGPEVKPLRQRPEVGCDEEKREQLRRKEQREPSPRVLRHPHLVTPFLRHFFVCPFVPPPAGGPPDPAIAGGLSHVPLSRHEWAVLEPLRAFLAGDEVAFVKETQCVPALLQLLRGRGLPQLVADLVTALPLRPTGNFDGRFLACAPESTVLRTVD